MSSTNNTQSVFSWPLCKIFSRNTAAKQDAQGAAYNEYFTAPCCRICGITIKTEHITALYCFPKFVLGR